MFKIYAQIKRTSKQSAEYKMTVGKTGIITRESGRDIGVKFDDITNSASGYGVFWFDPMEVILMDGDYKKISYDDYKLKTKEIKNMECKKLEPGYQVVQVMHKNGYGNKLYSFAAYSSLRKKDAETHDYIGVTEDDQVVEIMGVYTLDEAKENGITLPQKQLKGIIDSKHYNDRVNRAKRRVEIKAAMDKRVKQLQADQIYEMFAKNDPELAKLLTEYKEM